MIPTTLKDVDLKESMNALLTTYHVMNCYEIDYSVDDTISIIKLPEDTHLHIYRIVQEQMNNVLKYAHAKKISLELSVQHNQIILSLSDDGVGFDSVSHGHGIGFENMRKRAELVNAKIEFISSINQGCTMRMLIPI